jgi:2-polyprenyl-3-methyl-5-hydroxy-6-metoxy-1,4-benzoquinol methylase
MPQELKNQWWSEEYGFFGSFYMEGDNSKEGYLTQKQQTLKERTLAEVDGILRILSLRSNKKILDCPCGYGRHSIELGKRGFEVVGSDINSIHLQKAIDDAQVNSVKVTFRKESMLELKYMSEFDAVINMFYSFGFFETDEKNEKVLINFFNALKPGGKFLMHTDVNIPRIISGKYKTDERRNLVDGKNLRIIDNYDLKTKRINGAWIMEKNGITEKKDYSVRVYSKEEFEEMCKKIGFTSIKTYSNWEGDDYFENSEDMIVVATK